MDCTYLQLLIKMRDEVDFKIFDNLKTGGWIWRVVDVVGWGCAGWHVVDVMGLRGGGDVTRVS